MIAASLLRTAAAQQSSGLAYLITFILFLPPLLPRMFNDTTRRVIFLRKATSKGGTDPGGLAGGAAANTGTVMAVNTKLQLTVLAVQARVQARQICDGFQILVRGFIFVLEAAVCAFGAGSA